MTKYFLGLGTIFFFATANAQQNVTPGQLSFDSAGETIPTGFVVFLGANAGYMDQAKDINSEGMPSSIKALGSYYLPSATGVFDLGYGWQNQQFSREAALNRAINAGTLEVAARYQFDNRWQTGVVMNHIFDKGANYAANQADVQFAGVQVLKEFGLEKGFVARVGGRVMTDLNIDRKVVNTAMLDFQLGWDAKAYNVPSVRTSAVQADLDSELDLALESESSEQAIVIEESVSQFDLSSAEVKANQEAYLKRLSEALANNKGLVREVQVIGHTDATGNDEINKPLSEQRAQAVADILKSNDLGNISVEARGVGAQAPLSDIDARNRRTEVKFIGVTDQGKLSEVLRSIE